jgi:hypothetical protein
VYVAQALWPQQVLTSNALFRGQERREYLLVALHGWCMVAAAAAAGEAYSRIDGCCTYVRTYMYTSTVYSSPIRTNRQRNRNRTRGLDFGLPHKAREPRAQIVHQYLEILQMGPQDTRDPKGFVHRIPVQACACLAVNPMEVELRLGPSDISCTLSFILDQEATR